MAAKKKEREDILEENEGELEQTTPSKSDMEAQRVNQLVSNAYTNGQNFGQQEVWQSISIFLEQRMMQHFTNKQDDLARELRLINEKKKKKRS